MSAAAENLDFGQWNPHRAAASEIAPQRFAGSGGGRMERSHGHCNNGIGAEAGLVRRAVQFGERAVDIGLIANIFANQRRSDFVSDPGDRAGYTVAAKAIAAIAQVYGLMGAA